MSSEKKVAFITGGGSGIGRASALALARSGHVVMVADMDEAAAAATAESVLEAGGHAEGIGIDVSSEEQVREAITRTITLFGGLNSAVNCAGIQGELGATGDCELSNWERTLAVNLTGTFLCMREEIRAMRAHGAGSIVNISSNFGIVGKAGIPAYCASKHGVIGLTKAAALDHAPDGIRINVVCPGPTRTAMLDKIVEESGDQARALLADATASIPLGRLGEADDVASAVDWLCSDSTSFVTGTTLPVDGGFVIG